MWFVGHPADIEAGNQLLELAVIALGAGKAVVGVVGENQFRHSLSSTHYACGIGPHHHSFHHLGGAGRSQVAPSLNLNHAYAAGGRRILDAGALQVHMTEGRDIYADTCGRVKDGCSFGHAYGPVIYS